MGESKLVREWIEEIDGKPMECKEYSMEINGRTFTGISRRPHVSPEQRKINDAIVCQILVNTLGRRKKQTG